MTVALDNTFLTLILNPAAPSKANPATGKPVTHCKQRIEALIDSLKYDTVIIPAPCLAEALVVAPDVRQIVAAIHAYTAIEIAPFDAKAAIELALMTQEALRAGHKSGDSGLPWQHVKFDRQIIAIARAHGASVLYTDDGPQENFATVAGLKVKHTWDLDLPPEYAQEAMDI